MSNSVRDKIETYFSSANSTSSRMMADITSLRQQHGAKWDNLDPDNQADILWRSLVNPEVLKKYSNTPSYPVDVECFPVLRIKPGQKIVVDEDTTSGKSFGCSWQDEHSAPFRWETQSQLDLRISENEAPSEESQVTAPEASVEAVKESDTEKQTELKKEEEIKRPSILKRPEVPPPPVPPHVVPPVPAHTEVPQVPPHSDKSDNPIYARVVKRKSSSKTLLMSEMKAHRRAKEEMKPAVPPRMSLELKNLNLSQFVDPNDADGIPKTGFDFLDNW